MGLDIEIRPVKIVCEIVRDDYFEYPRKEFIEIDISTNRILARHIAGEIVKMTDSIAHRETP